MKIPLVLKELMQGVLSASAVIDQLGAKRAKAAPAAELFPSRAPLPQHTRGTIHPFTDIPSQTNRHSASFLFKGRGIIKSEGVNSLGTIQFIELCFQQPGRWRGT
jgi:hypothetical protein